MSSTLDDDPRYTELVAWLESKSPQERALHMLRGLCHEFQADRRRKRGRPRKTSPIGSEVDEKIVLELMKLGFKEGRAPKNIRPLVEHLWRAGELSRNTAVESHVKRVQRTIKGVDRLTRRSPDWPRLLARALIGSRQDK
jgi:hypothetical protein